MLAHTFRFLKPPPTWLVDPVVALALVLIYYAPLISLGLESHLLDTFDQRSFIYIFEWFFHCLAGQGSLSEITSPNFFYPHKETLLWSDLLFGFIPLYLPLRLMTGNPITAVNVVAIILSFIAALGVIKLARLFTDRLSIIAPIIATCGLISAGQEGHLQIKGIALVTWLLWALAQLQLTKRTKWAVLALWLWGILFQISAYLSLIVLYTLPLSACGLLVCRRLELRAFVSELLRVARHPAVIVSASAVAVLTGMTALLYAKGQSNVAPYNSDEVITYSARLLSFFDAPSASVLYRPLYSDWGSHEAKLSIGSIGILFALIGALIPIESRRVRHTRNGIVALSLTAAVLSLGPYSRDAFTAGHHLALPSWILWKLAPGFKAMRVAGRFGQLFGIGIAVLAELGAWSIATKTATSKALKCLVIILASGIVFIENRTAFQPQHVVLVEAPEFYRGIASVTSANSSIVELPLTLDDHFSSMSYFISQELQSTFHFRRILVGYSSKSSSELQRAVGLWGAFRTSDSVELLDYVAALGIDHLVLNRNLLSSDNYLRIRKWLETRGTLAPVLALEERELWAISSSK